MKKLLSFFIILIFLSCEKNIVNKFPIIKEFNSTKSQYLKDTIELENISTEGGELIAYHNNSNNLIFDCFVYGETGKLNYTYFTDKKMKIKFVIKKDYNYDRPITDENIKIDSTIYYINFENQSTIYDKKGIKIKNNLLRDSLISDVNNFMKETIKNNVNIRKYKHCS